MIQLDIDNQTDLPINTTILEAIATTLTDAPIELLIVDNQTIERLNQTHRGKTKPTDVLSFPLEGEAFGEGGMGLPLGSIVIAAPFVQEKATLYGHGIDDELALLFIHGVLHLLGYDHETDNGEMRAKEHTLIEQWGLPSSLIIRTEES